MWETWVSKVDNEVIPAFKEYLQEYLKLSQNVIADNSIDKMNAVKSRQAAYDDYSAIKDPAVGLFDAYFGKEWSKDFVHDFLFTLSNKDKHQEPIHKFNS